MNVPILLEWKNFLDILVISFILHRLLHLLKEPEDNQTDRYLEGDGAAHEEEEPMQYETDDEDI